MPRSALNPGITRRFGAGRAARAYPLPVGGELAWQTTEVPGMYRASVPLGDLQPDEILVPSVTLLTDTHYGFQCSLTAGEHQWLLPPVATDATLNSHFATAPVSAVDLVSCHIDLFTIHQALATARLDIVLYAPSMPSISPEPAPPPKPPVDYLVVVSHRPGHLPASGPQQPRPACQVPAISQMRQPAKHRARTCSPTAVSMLMAAHAAPYHPAFIDDCRDPTTGMFGVWPLNIIQASRRNFTGAIELISDWQDIASVPGPFVASVQFGKGELHGSPLTTTGGHLVVVRGTTDTAVLCNDPAAETAAAVPCSYDLAQFSRAWLGYRGAAYILQPATPQAATAKAAR